MVRAHKWSTAIVGAVALAALAGCSSSTGSVEPKPGEIDWDVAVTRALHLYGVAPGEGAYDPWQHQVVRFGDEITTETVAEDVVTSGLDVLCTALEDGNAVGLPANMYIGTIAEEAVNGAVLASASDEFRDASSVVFVRNMSDLAPRSRRELSASGLSPNGCPRIGPERARFPPHRR